MLLPRIARSETHVHKSFYDAQAAQLELQLTQVLSEAYAPCRGVYPVDCRHVLLFDRGTPLTACPCSLQLGRGVFAALLQGLSHIHKTYGVAHLSVCPDHVIIIRHDEMHAKLVDTSTLRTLGSPLVLVEGMRRGFTPPDAMRGDHHVEGRHDIYAAAVTSLWAIRRQASFQTLDDSLYQLFSIYVSRNASVGVVRSVWSIVNEEMFLLPHLILGGVENHNLNRVRALLGVTARPTRKRTSSPPPRQGGQGMAAATRSRTRARAAASSHE